MELPPKDDPDRPLHVAARLLLVLGIVLIGGTVIGAAIMLTRRKFSNDLDWGERMIALSIAYAVPGVLYLLCGIYVKHRRSAAVVVGLVLASTHLLLAIGGVFWLLLGGTSDLESRLLRSTALVMDAGLIVILILTLMNLVRSFLILQRNPSEARRAFELLEVREAKSVTTASQGAESGASTER